MEIAITGASGLIGTALTRHLTAEGHQVIAVTRSGTGGIHWDPAANEIDSASFEGIDAVIHLAGEGIAEKRWSDEQKRRILDSRVAGTTLLARTLASLDRPPSVLLSGSAIGYYGDRGSEELTEDSAPGDDFLAGLVSVWEGATADAEAAGIRVAHLRTGIVLAREGGVLGKLLPLYKFGLGGKLGNGRQYMSWVSIDDEVGIISWLLANDVRGPVNLTGPEPVTNHDFTKALGAELGRPTFLAVPSFGPKILLGAELAQALLFSSARVLPAVATEHGYPFRHRTIAEAFAGVLAR
jgi:uncharacterized protein (TIGR01777 family)